MGFPSWSWAGWAGRVALYGIAKIPVPMEVGFELAGGEPIGWDDLISAWSIERATFQPIEGADRFRILRLKCPAYPIEPAANKLINSLFLPADMILGNMRLAGKFRPTDRTPWDSDPQYFLQGTFLVIPLGLHPSATQTCFPHDPIIVVRDMGDFWERVGSFEHSYSEDSEEYQNFQNSALDPTGYTTIRLG
jgi:hypothetical protein